MMVKLQIFLTTLLIIYHLVLDFAVFFLVLVKHDKLMFCTDEKASFLFLEPTIKLMMLRNYMYRLYIQLVTGKDPTCCA
jgi:hypothetical protein